MEVSFLILEAALAPKEIEAAAQRVLDQSLVEGGLVSSYEITGTEGVEGGDLLTDFAFDSDEFGAGMGHQILRQEGRTLHQLVFVTTSDDASTREIWRTAAQSFASSPAADAAPPAPKPDTPAPPTAAPAEPTATAEPPAPPPQPPGQGCYRLQDHLGVELTVTITAQDRQWSDTFSVPANGEKDYCLDPGRYTFTIDAPPPWSDINGDLEVQAGDRFLWPIEGQ
jgi:hypothetical protein